jgi:formate--tetrahydrofolate ligase
MLRPILEVAEEAGFQEVYPWGPGRAKIADKPGVPTGKLVLVSAITPTPAGEGKTTTSIALSMGLRKLGVKTGLVLRQPSMGPVFGRKGGGTGGGLATIEPSTAINLHSTGDIHAIGAAHNLLADLADHGLENRSRLDARRVFWRRVLDLNDKALRRVLVGLEGIPRETGFDITAASEVMAALCLSEDKADLETRLQRLVVGEDSDGKPVTAQDLQAVGAMSALLQEALWPTLVQTREGGPVLLHGGPFANIAHGCNSRIATRLALSHSEVVLTEAGFAFDLGGEKFLNIKARAPGLWPSKVVLVVTVRALKLHGQGKLENGLLLLLHHLRAVQQFQLPALVVANRFPDDGDGELKLIEEFCQKTGADFAVSEGFAAGGRGSRAAAEILLKNLAPPKEPRYLYSLEAPILEKLKAIATTMYAAREVVLEEKAKKDLIRIEKHCAALGLGGLPICVARTQLSLTDDPKRIGFVEGHILRIRELRLYAGAGFITALAGEIQTMPGLPKEPSAWKIRVENGEIKGLMQGD